MALPIAPLRTFRQAQTIGEESDALPGARPISSAARSWALSASAPNSSASQLRGGGDEEDGLVDVRLFHRYLAASL